MSDMNVSRRGFVSGAAIIGGAMALGVGKNTAWAAGSDRIKVGLIGCGGRGSGAATDCAAASPLVKIVAMGDLFKDHLDASRGHLKDIGEQFAVTDEMCFVGWDAYKQVLATDVDLVILATPPAFRSIHLRAAIDAGKHVFAEKPVAVDPTGVRRVMEAGALAGQKGLAIVTGTQRRHDIGYIETIKRIHDGAIGDVIGGNFYWNQGSLWMHPRQSEWSDVEWQLRNWLYFTWLSGDHLVEQHIHQLDVMNWIMGGHPESVYAMGGRQVRTDPAYGQIYDHFYLEYEFSKGQRMSCMCRQQDGTDTRVAEYVVGTKGSSIPAGQIHGETKWRFDRPKGAVGPYQQEHVDLIESIVSGQPLNEAHRVAESTLTAIMGRMSAYTGKTVTWDQAMNSKLDLVPENPAFGPMAVAPVAMPGKTPLV